jgi:hypothetical protein
MKTRDLQALGFKPVILRDGRLTYMLPLAEISEAGAQAVSPAQIREIMRINVSDAQKAIEKLGSKLAAAEAKTA